MSYTDDDLRTALSLLDRLVQPADPAIVIDSVRGSQPARHRSRAAAVIAITGVIAVVLAIAASAVYLSHRTHRSAQPGPAAALPPWITVVGPPVTAHGFTVRLGLATDRVAAGQPIHGALLVDNDTGRPITYPETPCDDESIVYAGVANSRTSSLSLGSPVAICPADIHTIDTGRSVLPIVFGTVYNGCRLADSPPSSRPLCTPTGTPPLPAGSYRTVLVRFRLPAAIPLPGQLTVTLMAH
jgi:hypothetical protein